MEKEKMSSNTVASAAERKCYWDMIYKSNELTAVGWYQALPELSLQLIQESQLPKTAKIIDVGGGDSLLVDHLLERGYKDITVLDVSHGAIDKAKKRLGSRSDLVKWICSDVTEFEPVESYDLWHDRACFHFLTDQKDIISYRNSLDKALKKKGVFILGTFSKTGPKKCSGLPVHQYDEKGLRQIFGNSFDHVSGKESVHKTPSEARQNYVFCSFKNRIEQQAFEY
jgi:SAM-dependent methyltransferase